MFDQDIFA